ncbi:hypothetical protein GQ464_011855 [Rhodocaloribacter litoris]|uniref:CcmD family protein n=1 Tax=Rhodocaloribacter litoris TaxID=2558931 RepID=UPI00141DD73B|nr:hypothetical protein [Rhodocaloribacter litoris]QXD14149.1 hypothetical protein GQ464_011855 [Rhodocaloribacter litoris]
MLPALSLQEAPRAAQAAPYDSLWPGALPTQPPTGLEQVMLAHDKLYVVLAVVLIIWFGLLFFLYRTDRKLDALERTVEERIPEEHDDF